MKDLPQKDPGHSQLNMQRCCTGRRPAVESALGSSERQVFKNRQLRRIRNRVDEWLLVMEIMN